jgi:hypothetical protein
MKLIYLICYSLYHLVVICPKNNYQARCSELLSWNSSEEVFLLIFCTAQQNQMQERISKKYSSFAAQIRVNEIPWPVLEKHLNQQSK